MREVGDFGSAMWSGLPTHMVGFQIRKSFVGHAVLLQMLSSENSNYFATDKCST